MTSRRPPNRATRATAGAGIPRWHNSLVLFVLAAIGVGVYANALGNPFVIDDHHLIPGDARVVQGRLGALLTQDYWAPPRTSGLWRPLVSISFGLNWLISHEPWAFRLPNLALFVASAFVLYLFVRDVARTPWAGFAAAALFLVHPLHTYSLNSIVDRAEISVALCGLLVLWMVWRDLCAPRPRWWPFLTAAVFGAAAFSKEHALLLIPLAALLELHARRSGAVANSAKSFLRSVRRYYLPLGLVAVGYLGARVGVLGSVARAATEVKAVDNIIAQPDHQLRPGDSRFLARWGTPVAVCGLAGKLLVWPHPLSWDYSYAAIESVRRPGDPRLWAGLAVLGAAAAGVVVSYRRRSAVLVALGLLLIPYSLNSNTYKIIGTIFAERYLFLPSAGWCFLVGLATAALVRWVRAPVGRAGRRAAAAALLPLAVGGGLYGWLTIARNQVYSSAGLLNTTDLAAYPHSARLLTAVAADALRAGDLQRAASLARQAIAITPDFTESWRVAGLALYGLGRPDAALEHLTHSFLLGSLDEPALVAASSLMAARGEYARLLPILEHFVRLSPLAIDARNALAWHLVTAQPPTLRDPRRALEHAQVVLRYAPQVPEYVDTYVEVLLALGRRPDAVAALEKWLASVPPTQPGREKLAARLASLRQDGSASQPASPLGATP